MTSAVSASVESCCSFCGCSEVAAGRLVAGPAVYICGSCVQRAEQIIVGEQGGSLDDLAGKSEDELLTTVARLHRSRDTVEQAATRYVQELRGRGVTWARIGDTLGMSRQSAWERYSGEE